MTAGLELLPSAEAIESDAEFQAFAAEVSEAIHDRGPHAHLNIPQERVITVGGRWHRATVVASASGSLVAKQYLWGPTIPQAQAIAMNTLAASLTETSDVAEFDVLAPHQYALIKTQRGIAVIMQAVVDYRGQPARSLYDDTSLPHSDDVASAASLVAEDIVKRVPRQLHYLLDDLEHRNILCTSDPDVQTHWRDASYSLIDQCHRARSGARLLLSRQEHLQVPQFITRLAPGYVFRLTETV